MCLSEQTIDFKYWSYAVKTETERDYLVKLGEKQGEKFISLLMSLQEDNVKEDTVKEDTLQEDTLQEGTVKEDTLQEGTVNEDALKSI
jgi:hypothetical protein